MGVVRDGAVVAEVAEAEGPSHGARLPRLVQAALERAGVGWDGVGGLAVSIGPGSFTGLRIGLSLAKGIAYAGRLPIAAVPTLILFAIRTSRARAGASGHRSCSSGCRATG